MMHPRASAPVPTREHPLAGRRIVLTRPADQAGDFEERVRALGGEPDVEPAIAIRPPDDTSELDAALARLDDFDWIVFTSANAVHALGDRACALGIGTDHFTTVRLAAVGPLTAAALAAMIRVPDAIARSANAKSLGEEVPVLPGARVLMPRGDLADEALPAALRARGAEPHEVIAYRTVPGEGIPRIIVGLRDGTIDALLFASGSAVRFVADAWRAARAPADPGGHRALPAVFCIGPSTARAASDAGFPPDGVAPVATQPAMVDAMARWYSERSR
ncbi:MAG TPA: uroporphyrinogen-III synthase [Albitalea sp.]